MSPKTFLFNKIKAQKFRLNGIQPSDHLPHKRKLCQAFRDHVVYSPQQLPPKVDFRDDMTPVEDQSKIGSCAANCLAGAYEYLTKKSDGRNTDVSRLFIYYNARAKDNRGRSLTDSGCSMTSAIEALEEFGTCLESIWPYDVYKVNTRPSDQAFDEAKNHTITEALQIDINLNEMKSCLAQGFPFAFGLRLFKSFDQASKTGVVPMPNASDRIRSSHGSHALLAVGYSDNSHSFIVRNSWGENWGDKGYCYIPYEYMTNPELCFDAWAVRKLAKDNFSTEHWDTVDSVNYLKLRAAIIAVMSSDNNDDACDIQDVDEDDEPNQNQYDFANRGQNNNNNPYPNNQGWQRQDNPNFYPGYNGPPPPHHHHHHHHHPPPPPLPFYGQQQQYDPGPGYKPQSQWTAADYYQHETGFMQQNNNNFGGNQFQGSYPPPPPPNDANQRYGDPRYGNNNYNYGYRN